MINALQWEEAEVARSKAPNATTVQSAQSDLLATRAQDSNQNR
jgi:hypothetical protein